ncbi:DMT family transporter [Pseudohoeflea coraliihabitans]|uniref:DMT family transporter n=1 Tax=Pseudohoeflea coraliihabitans TaxID=2860393 RepID=A0ABS6WRN6_9HYPH|nr:DMT family transporter [Pseudohoeflea sp. DP4N28-3]MBW3098608.1 DMT family transporter [Pseudohoeflea sp. DP4N28-3]
MFRIALFAVLGPMLWGTTYAVFTEFLPTTHPFFTGVIRALPAGLLLLALNPVIPKPGVLMRYAVLAVFNIAVFFSMLFVAAGRVPGGLAATLGAVQPLVVVGLVALIGRHAPHPVQVAAGIAGVAGVGLMVFSPSATLDMIGVMAALGGAVSMGVGTVLIDRWGRAGKPLEMVTWQMIFGGLILAPVAWLKEGLPPAPDLMAVAGYGWLIFFGTAFGYYAWNRGVTKLGPSAAYLALASPVTATLIGTLVMDERFGLAQWAGILLVLGAIITGVSVRRRRLAAIETVPTGAA